MSNLQRMANKAYEIGKYLQSKGIIPTNRVAGEITARFLKEKGLPHRRFNSKYKGLFKADICNAESVCEHYEEFKKWVVENYKPQS